PPDSIRVSPKFCLSEKEDRGVCWIYDQFMSVKEIAEGRRIGNLDPVGLTDPRIVGAPYARRSVALLIGENWDADVQDIGIGRRDGEFDPPRSSKEAGPGTADRAPTIPGIDRTLNCDGQIALRKVRNGCVLAGEVAGIDF